MKKGILLLVMTIALLLTPAASAANTPQLSFEDVPSGYGHCGVYYWHFWYPGSPGGWWCYTADWTRVVYMGW